MPSLSLLFSHFFLLFLVIFNVIPFTLSKDTMVWLCLERCDDGKNIEANLNTLDTVSSKALTSVSFERYDLGPHSSLIYNKEFTSVVDRLRAFKGYGGKPLRLVPMITTVDIDRMRTVFGNPDPFIQTCLSEAHKHGYTGYNIDWEPEHGVHASDAAKYVQFLKQMAHQLHSHGLIINVDVASWSDLWDVPALIHQTGVDRVITMDTYVGSQTSFQHMLHRNIQYAGNDTQQLGIGLMSTNPNTGHSLGRSDLDLRFKLIESFDIPQIDIWRMTQAQLNTSSIWWHYLNSYLSK